MTKNLRSAVISIAFAVIGICWALVSPIGSSADDDFHLTSIWCANGSSEYCKLSDDGLSATVPTAVGQYPCPVDTWSTLRLVETCIQELGLDEETTVTTNFNSSRTRPNLYYEILNPLVSSNYQASALNIRIFNVVLAALLLFVALSYTTAAISRATGMAWALAIVPIGIFYIASANSSSWVITGVGLYWAFLASLLSSANKAKRETWILIFALIFSAAISVAARSDSVIYLSVITVLLLARYQRRSAESKKKLGLILLMLLVISAFSIPLLNRRFGFSNFSFPGANIENGWPNPVLNALIEFPHYFVAMFGGQPPVFTMRGTTFSTGVGWVEYSLPSATGILISMSVFGMVFAAFQFQTRRTFATNAFGWASLVILILIALSRTAFDPIAAIQPRYFYPFCLALIGLSLITDSLSSKFPSRKQSLVAGAFVMTGSLLAWLRVSSFYSMGSTPSYTNFYSQTIWWRDGVPSRSLLFIVLMIATIIFMSGLFIRKPRSNSTN